VNDIRVFFFLILGLGGITKLGLSNLDGNSEVPKMELSSKSFFFETFPGCSSSPASFLF
jgi:hypothetical protein